jgi:DNA-binding FrmR family transcriptional regulator
MINEQVQRDSLLRLRKIEGQVKGIQRMVEQRKYCIDIINQITAVRRALDMVSLQVMKRHIQSCVTEAIKQNRPQEKVNELMETIYKFVK